MGIPSYYKKLCDSIPGLLSRTRKGKCTYMWIDFNCMIYHCLRRPGARPYEGPETQEAWEAQFIQSVCDYLEHLVKIVGPTAGVFVAVDGVVPMAKIRQQRLRRFKSLWTAAEELRLGKSSGGPRWDTNAITPGTAFMEKLGTALHALAKRHPSWKISAADEPGEGEQKVMEMMRKCDEKEGHVVYGLDADLILLSLLRLRKGQEIYLFREAVEFGEVQYVDGQEEYRYLSVPMLAGALKVDLLDYCMCMSFVGNDFLPHGLSLSLRNDGHAHILRMMKEVGPGLVHETDGWNSKKLHECLAWLAKHEEEFLLKGLQKKKRMQHLPAEGVGWEREYDEWFKTPLRSFDEKCLVYRFVDKDIVLRRDWQDVYYDRYLENNTLCEAEYIRGLHWIYCYYMGYTFSSEWMYPWHLPPTWKRLSSTISAKPLPFSSDISLKPQEQLALVLPLASWPLIRDKTLSALPTKNPALWPSTFRLFMAGKRAIWECEALIPLFTPKRLRYLVSQIK